MAFVLKRKTSISRGKYMVTLPKAWGDFFADSIDTVTVVGQNLLIIAPQGLEERALRLIKEDRDD